jgi:DNA-binding winged helix-turn-helix (wHTH) protein
MKYFPPFRLDEHSGVLVRSGVVVPLSRKATALLTCLVAHPRTVVTHEEIMLAVWADTHVQPDNIKSLVHELRVALGDDPHQPQFIRSEPGRGYMLVTEVTDAMPPLFSDQGTPRGPLAGREHELKIIDRHLGVAAEQCQPQLVLIEGSRGIGKTQLCETFARRVRSRGPVRISYAAGIEVCGTEERYGILLDALTLLGRQYPQLVRDALRKRAPGWLAAVPHLGGLEAGTGELVRQEASDDRLLREISGALDELSVDFPLILVLEDLHWSDEDSIGALRHIARSHFPGRVLIVGTYTDSGRHATGETLERLGKELSPTGRCSTIRLRPLDKPALIQILEQRYGPAIAQTVAGPIYRAGGGNPLFALLAVEHLVRSGLLEHSHDTWQLTAPLARVESALDEAIRDGLETLLDRLGSFERAILEAGASIGGQFTAEDAEASLRTGRPAAILRSLSALADRHLFVEIVTPSPPPSDAGGPWFRFRHPVAHGLLLDAAADRASLDASDRAKRIRHRE